MDKLRNRQCTVISVSDQQGQAISEFIVVMAVLLPLLLVIASFTNLLNLSTETIEAGRLAAWERTVYKPKPGFDANEIQKNITKNVEALYLKRPFSDFTAQKDVIGKFPSLVDRSVNSGQPVSLRFANQNFSGAKMVHQNSRLVSRLGFNGAQVLQSPEVSIALNKDYSVFRPFKYLNYRQTVHGDVTAPLDPIAGRRQFNVSSKAALLVDGWVPADSQQMQVVTSNAAFDDGGVLNGERQALGAFESNNPAFSLLGFREARMGLGADGLSTSAVKPDTILPVK